MSALSPLVALFAQTLALCSTVLESAVKLKVSTTAMCTHGQQLTNPVLW